MRVAHLLPVLTVLGQMALAQSPALITWQDTGRARSIPVAIHQPVGTTVGAPIVVFSHGYGENQSGSYLAYGYLLEALAEAGWFVLSIQHELPTDPPLTSMVLLVWYGCPIGNAEQRTSASHFRSFNGSTPNWIMDGSALLGHSNGGDMSVLVRSSASRPDPEGDHPRPPPHADPARQQATQFHLAQQRPTGRPRGPAHRKRRPSNTGSV
jgi:hypothetical protein